MECGTDIIEISRMKNSIERCGETFIAKIFTPYEIEYCESKKASKYQHYAARFAAKEAVSKVLGTGFNGNFDWKEIEVRNDELGKPEIVLLGSALEYFKSTGYTKITVSISHCKEYATSMVIGY